MDCHAWLRTHNRGDTVFVLYSGHGVEIAGTPYLLPFDTSALDDDTLVDSALAVAKFRQRLAPDQGEGTDTGV